MELSSEPWIILLNVNLYILADLPEISIYAKDQFHQHDLDANIHCWPYIVTGFDVRYSKQRVDVKTRSRYVTTLKFCIYSFPQWFFMVT